MARVKMPKIELTLDQVEIVVIREMEDTLSVGNWAGEKEWYAAKTIWEYYTSFDYRKKMMKKHPEWAEWPGDDDDSQ